MDTILFIVIICVIFYRIGNKKGYNRGRGERMEINKITWYRRGMNKILDEMCEMEQLDDNTLVSRVREMINRRKDKRS